MVVHFVINDIIPVIIIARQNKTHHIKCMGEIVACGYGATNRVSSSSSTLQCWISNASEGWG